ncbi:MAG: phosphoglycerate dehydrogenase [Bacteroidia bacterium]|nr:phosphoglycerate dehydrogenase [Bacteroidia bacterium]NNJ55525.1 phosphoglycerate dehydrogenase [Bacteroidia bacterium]
MKKEILISTSSFGKVDATALELLENNGFSVELNPFGSTMTQEQSIELLKNKVGLIAGTEKINALTFDSTNTLKYICRLGTGMDSVDLVEAKKRGIVVENTPDAHIDGVAELCLAGMLDLHRDISLSHSQMKAGVWKKPMGTLLKGKTLGLIGLGKVSKRLIELLQAFDLKIMATDIHWDEEFASKWNIKKTTINEIMEQSDVVSIHIPYSTANRHIIGSRELAMLKNNAKVINTSRGGLVDENALISFLTDNPSARAYIDTFENEPYSGELVKLNNVLVTPHIGSYAKEVRMNMELECANKIIAFFS